MKQEELSPRQLQLVESKAEVVVALGGPGTGKTTAALWTARRALDAAAAYQRVLFLTFSRTAVSQISKGLPEVLGADRGRIEVSTFHGFAFRLLAAFGRYSGGASGAPALQTESDKKLFGPDPNRLRYRDLLPACMKLFESKVIERLLRERWPVIVCDEFQDTDDRQWELLQWLGKSARLVLLGDPDQMIYTFLKQEGVGEHRLATAVGLADEVVYLEPTSHRDPTSVIPEMAVAVRMRDFGSGPVSKSVAMGRLRVLVDVGDDQVSDVVIEQIGLLHKSGHRSVGVFGHSNEGVSVLGAALARAGVDHVLVGISEAQAEAMSTMLRLCEFAIGLCTARELRVSLAMYLTACTRGANAPELALRLVQDAPLPKTLATNLEAVCADLQHANGQRVEEVLTIVFDTWRRLLILSGNRPWKRSCQDLASLARPYATRTLTEEVIEQLRALVTRRRPRILVDLDSDSSLPVQLMNLYQTKGREADAVILLFRPTDYFGGAAAPFVESSRLLFVALTRARKTAVVILPPSPHPLVAPFGQLGL